MLLLDRNRITDVLALSPMAELANLGLAGNPIANLWPLEGLGQLHRLDLSGQRRRGPVGARFWALPFLGRKAPCRERWAGHPRCDQCDPVVHLHY